MNITITIDTDSSRTLRGEDHEAVAEFTHILHQLAAPTRWPPQTRNVLDRHGNTVGFMWVGAQAQATPKTRVEL